MGAMLMKLKSFCFRRRVERTLTIGLTLSLGIAVAPISAQRRRQPPPAGVKPLTARFLVKAKFEETYSATKNQPNERSTHESRLTMVANASRWVVIGKNEVGNVEFQSLEGGKPASATGSVNLNATLDSSSQGTSMHA